MYKAQADGIVNDDPTLNIIAVKTLKESECRVFLSLPSLLLHFEFSNH